MSSTAAAPDSPAEQLLEVLGNFHGQVGGPYYLDDVDDEPRPESNRAVIEANTIAMVCHYRRSAARRNSIGSGTIHRNP